MKAGFSIGISLAITLLIETPVVAAFYPRQRKRMALICVAVTGASNLLMNVFLLYAVRLEWTGLLCWAELTAFLLEAVAYWLVVGDKQRALLASAAANMASFVAGLLVWRLILFLGTVPSRS